MIREPVSPVDQHVWIRDLAEARAYLHTRPLHERRALLGAAQWCQVYPLRRLPPRGEYHRGDNRCTANPP
jgi:hypothetical protein